MRAINAFYGFLVCFCCINNTLGSEDCAACGKSNIRVKRVVGGEDASSGDWPWQVSLQVEVQDANGNESYHFCGGSILNKNWIVTATHCGVIDLGGVKKVFVGINKIGSYYLWNHERKVYRSGPALEVLNPYMQTFDIVRTVSYPTINPRNRVEGEVFMMKLSRPIDFNTHIRPVCLPNQDQQPPVGMTCWTTGWGVLGQNSEISPKIMQEVDLVILDKETCWNWYNSTRYRRPPGYITDNMVCAGYIHGGKSSCFGDSGGPLVCQRNNRWELYGIVSHGGICGAPRNPGIYVYVPKFVDWIQQVITDD